ncbi:MAG TPA: hypothetical protein VLJ86_08745 [Ramlibacter sp.]|nr:hypothetical protein [Ramlibacter sp.]
MNLEHSRRIRSVSNTAVLATSRRKLPQELHESLTWNRGKEMAAHKQVTVASGFNAFFCDPQIAARQEEKHLRVLSPQLPA